MSFSDVGRPVQHCGYVPVFTAHEIVLSARLFLSAIGAQCALCFNLGMEISLAIVRQPRKTGAALA